MERDGLLVGVSVLLILVLIRIFIGTMIVYVCFWLGHNILEQMPELTIIQSLMVSAILTLIRFFI